VDEHEKGPVVVSQHEVASLVVRLARAVEQTTELLEAATELHRNLAELDGAITESLVDLERFLAEAQKQTPK
jgi:predicted transcriptional regulator